MSRGAEMNRNVVDSRGNIRPARVPLGAYLAVAGIGWVIGLGSGVLVGAEIAAPGTVMRGLRQARGLLARRYTP